MRRLRMTRTTAGLAALTLLLSAALSAATSTTSAHAAGRAPTFTIGMTNEVDSFNPFNGIEASSFEAWSLMYDYMISWSDKDMSPQPALAKSWETSEDGLTWTFDIRSDVKWTDGKPLTADDIAYTYNRILDGGPESGTWGSYLTSVEKITAPDATTVVLSLKKPNAVLPLLPMPIIPEHIWKDVAEDEVRDYSNEAESPDQPVIGSGPFKLVEGKAGGSTYRFVRNNDYWDGPSELGEVVMQVYRSQDTLVQALKAGELDFAEGVTPLQVKALEGEPGITAQMGDSPGFSEIAFNVGSVDVDTGEPMGDPNPAVLDKDFRFALNFAIDREQIAEVAFQGGAEPATNIIPPAYTTYYWEPPEDAYAYDPEKAESLLDAAGYTVGDDGWRTMPDGSPIGKLRLFARSDSETSQATMDFFKEWLADVQIDSTITAMESSKLTNVILEGEYDTFEWGWYVEPDPDSILSYFTCGQLGSWNDSWYCDPDYDKLYEQQNGETDLDLRADIVKKMQQMLYEDAPYLNTVYDQIGEAYRSDRWEGFVPQPNPGGVLLFQYGHANYLNVAPAGSAEGDPVAAASTSDNGIDTGQTMIIVLLVVLVGGALVGGLLAYRKASAGSRE